MLIGEYNLCEHLKIALSKEGFEIINLEGSDFPRVDGIIIDWVTKNDKKFTHQAAVADHYARKTPTFLYDRFSSLTYKEYKWLSKFKVKFYEPLMLGRRGFDYLPQWTRMLTYDEIPNTETMYSIGYTGELSNDKIKPFEKYYKEYASLYPKDKVIYDNEITRSKTEEYRNFNLHLKVFYLSSVSFTILIDSLKNYNSGFLDPHIFSSMRNGCCPLLPIEHKYFHAMFKNLVVKNVDDISFISGSCKGIRDILIEEVYQNIENLYPEFTIDYATNIIKDSFK